MKHLNKQDKLAVDRLKRQAREEKEYAEKFLAARREVKRREQERETRYQRFKRYQARETKANERLAEYLKR